MPSGSLYAAGRFFKLGLEDQQNINIPLLVSHFCDNMEGKLKWSIEFLDKRVEDEFLDLPKDMQARFVRISELIEGYGLENVGMPHVRHLDEKLWEIRAKGKSGISRGIYVAVTGRRIIILRIFIKKAQKTPSAEIRLARERLKEL
jgi:phage-related protein